MKEDARRKMRKKKIDASRASKKPKVADEQKQEPKARFKEEKAKIKTDISERKKSYDDMTFGKAFSSARADGLKVFTWKGKKYTTKTKKESAVKKASSYNDDSKPSIRTTDYKAKLKTKISERKETKKTDSDLASHNKKMVEESIKKHGERVKDLPPPSKDVVDHGNRLVSGIKNWIKNFKEETNRQGRAMKEGKAGFTKEQLDIGKRFRDSEAAQKKKFMEEAEKRKKKRSGQ